MKITLDKLTHSNWEIKFEELNNDNNHVKSLYEQKKEYKNQRIEDAYNDKNVKAVLSHFPNAKLLDVIDAIPLPKAQDLIDSINNNDETED